VLCVVPSRLQPGPAKIRVRVGDEDSGFISGLASYGGPKVARISPVNGPSYGDTLLDIFGENLGTNVSYPEAAVNGIPCLATTLIAPNHVTCLTPAGRGRDLQVSVTVNGFVSEKNTFWTYNKVFFPFGF
jgi:hypothetical protein